MKNLQNPTMSQKTKKKSYDEQILEIKIESKMAKAERGMPSKKPHKRTTPR